MKNDILNIIERLNHKSELINSVKNYKIVTEIIKTEFAKKGEEIGCFSAAHKNRHIYQDYNYTENQEWLFDFVWYKMHDKDDQIMTAIPLVLESELSKKDYGGLKEDFDKLLIATSSTKVFVTKIDKIEEKRKYIQKAMNNFFALNSDEILFLIVWDEHDTGLFELEEFRKNS